MSLTDQDRQIRADALARPVNDSINRTTYDGSVVSGQPFVGEDEEVRMLHDLILVQRPPAESVTESGLIIPERARELSCHGRVVAIGYGRWIERKLEFAPYTETVREEMEIQVGDLIMYDGSAGAGVAVDPIEFRKGGGLVIVAQRDVLFIAEQDDDDPWKARELDEDEVRLHEPGGVFSALWPYAPNCDGRGCDVRGFFPVAKHLPGWLRARIIEAGGDAGERGERP